MFIGRAIQIHFLDLQLIDAKKHKKDNYTKEIIISMFNNLGHNKKCIQEARKLLFIRSFKLITTIYENTCSDADSTITSK